MRVSCCYFRYIMEGACTAYIDDLDRYPTVILRAVTKLAVFVKPPTVDKIIIGHRENKSAAYRDLRYVVKKFTASLRA